MTNFDFLREVCGNLQTVVEDPKSRARDDSNIIITAEKPFNTSGHDYFVYLLLEDHVHGMALICNIIEALAAKTGTTVEDILEHICPALAPQWAADHEVYPEGEN